MNIPTPLPLRQQTLPFDGQKWIYEIKHDGVRVSAVIGWESTDCSPALRDFYGFGDLRATLAEELHADDARLDGELDVMDEAGRTLFPHDEEAIGRPTCCV